MKQKKKQGRTQGEREHGRLDLRISGSVSRIDTQCRVSDMDQRKQTSERRDQHPHLIKCNSRVLETRDTVGGQAEEGAECREVALDRV